MDKKLQVEKWLSNIRPLDLLVFSGSDFVSNTIKEVEKLITGNGEISHVGLAINRTVCPSLKVHDDDIYVWESTMGGKLNDGVLDAEDNKTKFGVQVRRLRDVALAIGKAKIGYCKLICNPIDTASAQLSDQLCKVYTECDEMTYDASPIDLLGAAVPQLRWLRNLKDKTLGKLTGSQHWLFCSEFVAKVYIAVGVINDDTDGKHDGKILDPRDVIPVDLIGYDKDQITVKIVKSPVYLSF